MRSLRVLTWHVHGNYLLYLSQARVTFYLPADPQRGPGYGGRGATFPFGDNVVDIPASAVREQDFDCILYQTRRNYEVDRLELLSDAQRRLPAIFLEHDPPLGHPTDTRHWVDDTETLVVHVTPYNALMWDNGRASTRVIDHGVLVPEGVRYTGELPRGITAVNNLGTRGRRAGPDVFLKARERVPIDLVGMNSDALGGLGEIAPPELPAFEARYRFFFNPSRYTSLNLAVIEAMTLGMPIAGLATTEMATAVQNGVSGYVDTDLDRLVERMHALRDDVGLAQRLGQNARRAALERFHIDRFARDWEQAFRDVTAGSGHGHAVVAPDIDLTVSEVGNVARP